jgi:transposase
MDELYRLQRINTIETSSMGRLSIERLKTLINKTNIANIIETSSFDDIRDICWIWEGLTSGTSKGHQHGVFWFKGNNRFVHRLMFHNFIADVPDFERKPNALQVNHKCTHDQNGKCVNPWHMYLGTPKQNTQDAIDHGTLDNQNRVTYDEVVEELIKLRNNKKTIKEIAISLSVSTKTINRWIQKLNMKQDRKYNDSIKQKVIDMKLENKQIKEITSKLGVSKSTVLRYMREFKDEGSETTMDGLSCQLKV